MSCGSCLTTETRETANAVNWNDDVLVQWSVGRIRGCPGMRTTGIGLEKKDIYNTTARDVTAPED